MVRCLGGDIIAPGAFNQAIKSQGNGYPLLWHGEFMNQARPLRDRLGVLQRLRLEVQCQAEECIERLLQVDSPDRVDPDSRQE
jgi:hypothetical protein